ncbi:hypothetical protein ACFFP0_19325 [Rhizobium puerariae]|uniref:Uncharacterized protein n=1 Tax=Rhizobium puerariae TaxID=1585791 RepID=A0ABV6AK68_9HYPH
MAVWRDVYDFEPACIVQRESIALANVFGGGVSNAIDAELIPLAADKTAEVVSAPVSGSGLQGRKLISLVEYPANKDFASGWIWHRPTVGRAFHRVDDSRDGKKPIGLPAGDFVESIENGHGETLRTEPPLAPARSLAGD